MSKPMKRDTKSRMFSSNRVLTFFHTTFAPDNHNWQDSRITLIQFLPSSNRLRTLLYWIHSLVVGNYDKRVLYTWTTGCNMIRSYIYIFHFISYFSACVIVASSSESEIGKMNSCFDKCAIMLIYQKQSCK